MTDINAETCVIFDLDGTLADCRHRLHHIKNGNNNWPAFFDDMSLDMPSAYVVTLAQLTYNSRVTALVICSGRPDSHKQPTIDWLTAQDVKFDELLMRKTGDARPDVEVKLEMLEEIRKKYEVLFAVDDRPDIIKMWRENGVPCFAVEDHNWR